MFHKHGFCNPSEQTARVESFYLMVPARGFSDSGTMSQKPGF